jgi:hypothetical protein
VILAQGQGESAARTVAALSKQAEATLSVSGLVASDGSIAVIRRVRPATGEVGVDSIGDDGAGDSEQYSLELRASDGSALATTAVTPLRAHATDGASTDETVLFFEGVLPDKPGATDVVLVGDGRVLARRVRTPAAPVVTRLDVTSTGEGAYRVAWQASDADGDPLRFDVYYSPTAGKRSTGEEGGDWRPMAAGISKTTLDVRAADLERGRSPAVKVVASDGFNAVQRVEAIDLDLPLAPLTTLPGPGGQLGLEETVTVFFSTDLLEQDVTRDVLQLEDMDGKPVPADVAWDATTGALTLTPVAPLGPGHEYRATLRGGLRDRTGGVLPADVVWTVSVAGELQNDTAQPATPGVGEGASTEGPDPVVEHALATPPPVSVEPARGITRPTSPGSKLERWAVTAFDFSGGVFPVLWRMSSRAMEKTDLRLPSSPVKVRTG